MLNLAALVVVSCITNSFFSSPSGHKKVITYGSWYSSWYATRTVVKLATLLPRELHLGLFGGLSIVIDDKNTEESEGAHKPAKKEAKTKIMQKH